MPKVQKKKKAAKLTEHTVPYSQGSSVDWDNIFNELDEMFTYPDTRTDRQKARAAQGHDELARREKVLPTGHLADPSRGSEYKHKDDPRYQGMYKVKGPRGVLPEADVDPELQALMQKYGVETVDEADKPTKTASPTDMDWDTMFDEPTSKGDVAKTAKMADTPGPQTTADLKKGSRIDTARATAGITPTAAMADLMSRMNVPVDDNGVDEPEQALVPTDVTPEHVPAVISREIAMTDPHAINPTWHAVAHLPGNMSRAILTLGKALFRAFTKTPTEEITMIGNVGGQGPNSTREVNGVAEWLKRNGREVDTANIDFDQTIPGYSAQVKHYTAGGIRFKVVKDQFGDYIYAWPENDSIGGVEQIGDQSVSRRPARSLTRR